MVVKIREEILGISDHTLNSLSPSDLVKLLSTDQDPNPAKPLILAELFKVEGDVHVEEGNKDKAFFQYLSAIEVLLETSLHTEQTDFPEEFTSIENLVELLDEYVLPSETLAALFHYFESAGKFSLAEDTLFDYIEDEASAREGLEAGFSFVERLKEKSEEELAEGELTSSDIDEIESQLNEIKNSLDNS